MPAVPLIALNQFEIAQTVTLVIAIITLGHNICLVIYRLYHMAKPKPKKRMYNIIDYLSLTAMVIAVLFSLITVITSLQLHFNNCAFLFVSGSIMYLLTKTSLYFLYLERLYHVFHNSAYAFSKFFIWLSRIALIAYSLTMIVLLSHYQTVDINKELNICVGNAALWVIGTIPVVDFVVGIMISILFTRRLLMILANTSNIKNKCRPPKQTQITTTISNIDTVCNINKKTNDIDTINTVEPKVPQFDTVRTTSRDIIIDVMIQDTNTWRILKKFTLLTVLAIGTTLGSLILCALFEIPALWISIDMIINCWCVLLMFHVHNDCYIKMCSRLQRYTTSMICLNLCACNCCCCRMHLSRNLQIDQPKNIDKVNKLNELESKEKQRKTSKIEICCDDEIIDKVGTIESIPTQTTLQSNPTQESELTVSNTDIEN